MRKVCICLSVIALAVVPALAAGMSGKKTRTAPATRPATSAVAKSLRGEIVSVNIETKVITVKTADKQHQAREVAVTTDDHTQFTLDGAQVTLVDLRPEMPVAIQPETGMAAKVFAKSPPPKRKPKSNSEPAGDRSN